ncbi:Auxin-induced protein 5NG4 [Morus notabilis]|uniref:WAT1-related protein n=1 Tax=Morus notabilis TaxID=981085 RepID=W9RCY4_9ROSA|nr:WAT1-related protein At1g70260 [Morus notabilis]EXB82637.1 Auxin-induced protein 5NG4 [Morus notabilis]
MSVKPKVWEVVPFLAMVTMEGSTIALTIWAKTVLTNGMSPFVFVVYTHALSSLILFPFSIFFHRNDRTEQPIFTVSLFLRFFLLGLTGITIPQNLAFLGLSHSSPIVVCAMGLTLPAFSFILSLVLRKTEIDWRSSSFQTKVTGAIVCFMGATTVELFKGPLIKHSSSLHVPLLSTNRFLIFSSTPEYWILGGLLLAAANVSVSVWNVLQMETVKQYPQPMKAAAFYSALGTIQSAILSFFVLERKPDAWEVDVNNTEIPLIVLTATFVGLIRSCVHLWCMRMKGPFYVPMFKPFGLLFATTFGVSLPASTLRYGSVIGTAIVAMGYLTMMYGQQNEDEASTKHGTVDKLGETPEEKVPLLQEENV